MLPNRMEKMMEKYLIKPGTKFSLNYFDPDDTSRFSGGKEEAQNKIQDLTEKLDKLQEIFYAEHKHKLLIVLQARDAGGKDGTIRSVFGGINPQGVHVSSFKVPTEYEMDHDYLWRVHQQVPGRGEIVVFNRSHYEDVLVVRVHNIIDKKKCEKRYLQIKNFEKLLADEGTTILKFYLHISRDEQKKRLQERLDDPQKNWKFNPGDLKERELWAEYSTAYEAAIQETSTDWAPWYVIPANHNWYRNLSIASIIVKTMEQLNLQYPVTDLDPKTIVIK